MSGHVEGMGKNRSVERVLMKKLKERDYQESLNVDGRVILKLIQRNRKRARGLGYSGSG